MAASLQGCSIPVRAYGIVSPVDGGMQIRATNGESRPLLLQGRAEPMRWLDGHTVELEGRTKKGAIAVTQWRVVEGLHGLSCWVGELRDLGDGLGVYVPDADGTFTLDADIAATLRPWIGQTVLLEGYVEGTLGIHVMYYRPLFDESTAQPLP